jgi:hypothetical protein
MAATPWGKCLNYVRAMAGEQRARATVVDPLAKVRWDVENRARSRSEARSSQTSRGPS